MALQPVKSSFIDGVDHVAETNTLIVQIKGILYHVDGVLPELHAQMMAAESVGKFFVARIKGVFPSRKVLE
jgi:hypothetical protein